MAFAQALRRQNETLLKAVTLESDQAVFGACGHKAAARREQRGDGCAIEHDEPDRNKRRDALRNLQNPIHERISRRPAKSREPSCHMPLALYYKWHPQWMT